MIHIARERDKCVSQRAQEVRNVFSPEVQGNIGRLMRVMDETGAMGFAAPQIHYRRRLFVFSSYPHVNHENAPLIGRTVVINPEIHTQEEMEKVWEKCYSLPGIRGLVPRYRKITVSYTTQGGERIENQTFEGFPAHLFQHEFDHLEGLLYRQIIAFEDRETDIISEEEYKDRFSGDQRLE